MVKTILFSITIILVWVALCPAFVSSPSNPMVTQVIPAGSVIRTPIGQIILVRVDSLLVEPEYPRAPIIVPEPRRPEYPRPEPPRPPHQPTPPHQPEPPHQPNQPGHPHK